ncbi:aspartic peptidase domain-containing protein [Suillus spraguei]|nr:aspartic peptidase domain-containing protein [Suillus spraguei]
MNHGYRVIKQANSKFLPPGIERDSNYVHILSSLFRGGMVSYVAKVPNFATLSHVSRCILFDASPPGFVNHGSLVEIRNSPITLSIVGRLHFSDDTVHLLQHDQARAAALARNPSTRGLARSISGFALNSEVFITAVAIGSPPQPVNNLIVDTGSSNTWVGAFTDYVATKTTGQPLEVIFHSSSFSGTEYLDTITLSSGIAVNQQSIGVVDTEDTPNFSTGITAKFPTGVDCILGIGPDIVSAFIQPSNPQIEIQGQLTFGGTDATMYTSSIAYTPITTTSPASTFWGIDGSITYNSKTILSSSAGFFQSGNHYS